MSVYYVIETKRCGVSSLDDASSAKAIPGLVAVSQVKVSMETPGTIAKQSSPSSSPELFWFQEQAYLRKHLQSTSRFLRNSLAVIDSDKVVKKKEVLDINAMEVKPIRASEEERTSGLLTPDILPVAQEVAAALAVIAEEEEEEEALVGAVGGAFDNQTQKVVEAAKKERILKGILSPAQAEEAISPDVLYFSPPGQKESCFETLIYFSELRGQKISKKVQKLLKQAFMQSAAEKSLGMAIEEFLLTNKDKLRLVESKPKQVPIQVVAGELTKKELDTINAEIDKDNKILEQEKNKPINQKEQYKENYFLAQLLLTPESEWMDNQKFIAFMKMLCFENNVDLSSYFDAALRDDELLSDAENFDRNLNAKVLRLAFDDFKLSHFVLPEEFALHFDVDSLTALLNQYFETDNLPFSSPEDENTPIMAKIRYKYKIHFWIQAIERFNTMQSCQDVDEALMAVMKSASLSVKKDPLYLSDYRAMLNAAISERPVSKEPSIVSFKQEVVYTRVIPEEGEISEKYTPNTSLTKTIKTLDFGIDKQISLYNMAATPDKKYKRLLNIADYYDAMWKSDFLTQVREKKIDTLDALELEVALHISNIDA